MPPVRSTTALRVVGVALALCAGALAAGCSSSSSASGSSKYLVALGDSYSVGYQPGKGTGFGYTNYAANQLGYTLANFGCGGATTTSILQQVGCPPAARAKQGVEVYDNTTQVAAATAFLKAHKGQIGLITVSISGNDVTACAKQDNPISCVAAAVGQIKTNVTSLAQQLRAAAGPGVQIIGTTYPDVILGAWVYPSQPPTAARQQLATLSVTAFKTLINPTLTTAYQSAGGQLVDVTQSTGAYGPMTAMTTVAPYGSIPTPVARVCELTWFCAKGDIHPKDPGYVLIGQLVVDAAKSGSSGQ
jgi:lysophospholipase L1-like esterase